MKFASQRPLQLSPRRIVIRTAAHGEIEPRPMVAVAAGGRSLAAARIRHAVELAGSCMLIAAFVVLALFG